MKTSARELRAAGEGVRWLLEVVEDGKLELGCCLCMPSKLPTLIKLTPSANGVTSRSRTLSQLLSAFPTTVSSAQKGGAREGIIALCRATIRPLKFTRDGMKHLAVAIGCRTLILTVSDQIPPSSISIGAAW